MNKSVLALAFVAAAACCVNAFAQDAPLRGVGLLALNASGDSDSSGLGGGSSSGARGMMVDVPDEGGGSTPRNLRGGGDTAPNRSAPVKSPDALPPNAIAPTGDPAAPIVATPKRPTYRWQSLVPGAIK
ncbi:hypothetical protein [Dokdonella sp.]|uniref:hypothetical protein n=1 Tax=Dokdonella sp. TaxID=2291710 RepID=UPI001B13E115|nr:hypothetical protein [Dokdonella sp.]MBO9661421.1 hypothetical protein [Dokdonella sp.]